MDVGVTVFETSPPDAGLVHDTGKHDTGYITATLIWRPTPSDVGPLAACSGVTGQCDIVSQNCSPGSECVIVQGISGISTACQLDQPTEHIAQGLPCCPPANNSNPCDPGLECNGGNPCGDGGSPGPGLPKGWGGARCTPRCCPGDGGSGPANCRDGRRRRVAGQLRPDDLLREHRGVHGLHLPSDVPGIPRPPVPARGLRLRGGERAGDGDLHRHLQPRRRRGRDRRPAVPIREPVRRRARLHRVERDNRPAPGCATRRCAGSLRWRPDPTDRARLRRMPDLGRGLVQGCMQLENFPPWLGYCNISGY